MNTEDIIVKCLNCGKEYTGICCPQCGQKAKIKRLKFKEIIADFANSIIGGDNKFANTLYALCRRPGHMVREYLQGHRIKYYNPLQMLIWIISIYALLSYFLGSDPFELDALPKEEIVKENQSHWQTLMTMVKRCANFIYYNKLYYTLFCTLLIVGPYWLVFRKQKISRPDGAKLPLNHTEQFYAILYQSCMEMMFAVLLLPFCFIPDSRDVLREINNYAGMLFSIILYKQLYGIGWWKSIRCNIMAFILFIINVVIIILLLIALVMGVFALIYGAEEITIE